MGNVPPYARPQTLTWWDPAHGPLFQSPALGECAHAPTLAKHRARHKNVSQNLVLKSVVKPYLLTTYFNDFLKGFQILLHAVVRTQVGHKVAWVHAIKTVEERVDTGVEVDKVNL